jgi:BirA family transcriptional regulator, biotin operon repressor / biotin---[acetyl-CoA-carboxylase] ligase
MEHAGPDAAVIDIAAVRRDLAGTLFADVSWVGETGSTNADLLARARAAAPEGVVLVADHQTAGRGRLNRRWQAAPGSSLLLSMLTRPTRPPTGLANDRLHLVSLAVGVAAAEAIASVTGVAAGLKWPNDVVIDVGGETRKLSGVLADSLVSGGEVDALVVGIGINVNWPAEVPAELADRGTALNRLVGHEVDRTRLLVEVLRRTAEHYGRLAGAAGRAELTGRYRRLSATLGRRVRVEVSGETIIGDAFDVNSDGHLLVIDDCPDRPREISVSDVIHLRLDATGPDR